MSTRTLRCPSCDGVMREVDRRGLMIDICTECRGIFLDRGELDKLLETVDRWADSQAAYPAPPPPPPGQHGQPGYGQPGPYAQPSYGHGQPAQKGALGGIAEVLSAVVRESKTHGKGHHYGHHYGHKRRKKGGLGELFDDLLG